MRRLQIQQVLLLEQVLLLLLLLLLSLLLLLWERYYRQPVPIAAASAASGDPLWPPGGSLGTPEVLGRSLGGPWDITQSPWRVLGVSLEDP